MSRRRALIGLGDVVRINQVGLRWLFDVQKLVALASDAADVATSSGGHLTFCRCKREPGGVLAWELSSEADPSSYLANLLAGTKQI